MPTTAACGNPLGETDVCTAYFSDRMNSSRASRVIGQSSIRQRVLVARDVIGAHLAKAVELKAEFLVQLPQLRPRGIGIESQVALPHRPGS